MTDTPEPSSIISGPYGGPKPEAEALFLRGKRKGGVEPILRHAARPLFCFYGHARRIIHLQNRLWLGC